MCHLHAVTQRSRVARVAPETSQPPFSSRDEANIGPRRRRRLRQCGMRRRRRRLIASVVVVHVGIGLLPMGMAPLADAQYKADTPLFEETMETAEAELTASLQGGEYVEDVFYPEQQV